jgi:hemolysin activation/secretion protein
MSGNLLELFRVARFSALVGFVGTRVLAVFAVSSLAPAIAADAAASSQFDIFEFRVEGNSLLESEAIEKALGPHLGEARSFNDVEAARAALEATYHKNGWLSVLVTVPEQEVRDGEVGLQVLEAPIGRSYVRGTRYTAPGVIRQQVAELNEGRVPNFDRLQAELGQLNSNPDLKATPILKPGVRPGTVDSVLDIDDQSPVHGSVEISNRHSPNTSATRIGASVRYDNLFQSRHSLGLTVQRAPEDFYQIRVAALSYAIPLGPQGEAFNLQVVHSRSRLERLTNSPGLGVLGNADIVGLRWILPVFTSAPQPQATDPELNTRHLFTLGIDHKQLGQSILPDGGPRLSTPVAYAPLSLNYNASLQDGSWTLAADLGATLGLRGLLGGEDRAFAARRAGTSANFLVARAGFQASRTSGGWNTIGRLETQWSPDPVIGNEQFLMGGANTVRGYLEGETAGDRGARLSFEVRSPERAVAGAPSWRWMGLGFAEYATLYTLAPRTSGAPGAPGTTTARLGGAGLGLRFLGQQHWAIELDAARALENGPTTPRGTDRVHARVVYSD